MQPRSLYHPQSGRYYILRYLGGYQCPSFQPGIRNNRIHPAVDCCEQHLHGPRSSHRRVVHASVRHIECRKIPGESFFDLVCISKYRYLTSKLQRNALDVYGTYLSFCVTSRIPIIFTFLSACSLMGFLVIVAASVWPTAAIVLCGLSGVACTLQYLIYGLHSLWCFGFRVSRGIRNGIVRGCGRVFGKSTSPVSAGLPSEAVVTSDKTPLPPPAHLSNIITHAPPRPPRNPARLASMP
jgi:hypothetical protein